MILTISGILHFHSWFVEVLIKEAFRSRTSSDFFHDPVGGILDYICIVGFGQTNQGGFPVAPLNPFGSILVLICIGEFGQTNEEVTLQNHYGNEDCLPEGFRRATGKPFGRSAERKAFDLASFSWLSYSKLIKVAFQSRTSSDFFLDPFGGIRGYIPIVGLWQAIKGTF